MPSRDGFYVKPKKISSGGKTKAVVIADLRIRSSDPTSIGNISWESILTWELDGKRWLIREMRDNTERRHARDK